MIEHKNDALKNEFISQDSVENLIDDLIYFEDFTSSKSAQFIASTQCSKVECLKDMPPEKQQEMLRLYGGGSNA